MKTQSKKDMEKLADKFVQLKKEGKSLSEIVRETRQPWSTVRYHLDMRGMVRHRKLTPESVRRAELRKAAREAAPERGKEITLTDVLVDALKGKVRVLREKRGTKADEIRRAASEALTRLSKAA